MFSSFFRFIRSADWLLLASTIILALFGCAALYSIGLGKDPQNFTFLQKQATVLAGALFLLLLISTTNYRLLRAGSIILYAISLALLVAVLFFGADVRGTSRWFQIGGFAFQPVEFAKIALILMLARYFSRYTRQMRVGRHLFMTGILAFIPISLTLLQPDFGSAVILFLIWLGMIILSGIPKRFGIGLLVLACAIAPVVWFGVFKEYQKQRILTYLSPQSDRQGSGYNVRQAMIAIGEGQLFGRGLGQGSQSHLKFLPETQTDFIFSVLAEEVGLFGLGIIFLFWTLLFYRLTRIMLLARDDFALYSVLGVALFLLIHVVFNIGGNLGLIPFKGVVLPFMSYGGSALAAALVGIGIAQSVKIYSS
ncbi:rod shape-determining protein RodA [Candidatus Uhrbacteria bacterium]|nr:rod shape-determining protein RodA [Candidatus Uhrbacteria bacterium]